MEGIHGVDTSWLHHSRGRTSSQSIPRDLPSHEGANGSVVENEKAVTAQENTAKALTNGTGTTLQHLPEAKVNEQRPHSGHHLSLPHVGKKESVVASTTSLSPSVIPAPPAVNGGNTTPPSKGSKENGKSQSPGLGSRKSSWISSLSSKFSSSKDKEQKEHAQQAHGNATPSRVPPSPKVEKAESPLAANTKDAKPAEAPAQPSTSPKPTGFLSSALRRFSSSNGVGLAKSVPGGGICQRKVMNIDPHRERCEIPDLEPAKLRRVAFCVDVEIAATPKYRDDSPEDPTVTALQKKKTANLDKEKKSKVKNKERSEGEALKNPNAVAEKKETKQKHQRSNSSGSNAEDMFEIPDEDDKTLQKAASEKPPRQSSPPKQKQQPPQQPPTLPSRQVEQKAKSPTAPPLHHDFGPSGMFEVDDFEEVPEQKPKVNNRRGSTGGSPHHDFGRHGMFEIPSASEDEGSPETKSTAAKRRGSNNSNTSTRRPSNASSAGSMIQLPGHTYTEHLMFEIPDHEMQLESALDEASAKVTDSVEKPALTEPKAQDAPVTNGTADEAASGATNGSTAEAAKETAPAPQPADKTAETVTPPTTTRKKEKKKKSEEERKERKERKKQAAIANGSIPVELVQEDANTTGQQVSNKPRTTQNRPTTDPLRIYRRCCSLRETTPLPRVVEQLSSPTICDPLNPAAVMCLDLSGEAIQMHDLVTLGDWLGVVPVQKLMLESCGLNDESVRIVLSGLLAVKTSDQARHNRHLAKKNTEHNKDKKERKGVISKLSFKDNPLIGRQGWMHIAFFLNMSRSLKAIDLSMVPFPKRPPPPPPSPVASTTEDALGSRRGSVKSTDSANPDPFDVFVRCIVERHGVEPLEEIVMGECSLSAERVEKLIDAVIACKCSRFGLANNDLDAQGLRAIAKYLRTGVCVGLDLGGNNLSSPDCLKIIFDALDYPENNIYALSLAHTNISPTDLRTILPVFSRLPEFRFFDFSHNQKLFGEQPNALGSLTRWLPRMKNLKRFHLNDVSMSADDAIALAEICPEIPLIAHVSLLENPALTALANATEETAQEEACAMYASLMAATRVSKTIICIDIDVPSNDNSEVVKALAKQVVAYSLRNMERGEAYKSAAALIAEPHGGEKAVSVPDVLLQLIGHVDNLDDNHDNDPPAPDQDYLVSGTGVVKALSVVLGNRAKDYRRLSRDITPTQSGTNSPKIGEEAFSERKARDMSKNLLGSARKIRTRLQPALVRARADSGESSDNYRRLFYLDATLERMIQRFEDEYPECRSARPRSTMHSTRPVATSGPEPVVPQMSLSPEATPGDEAAIADDDEQDEDLKLSLRRSRHGSDVSLASRNLNNEEARIHRFSARVKREILPPVHVLDHHWGTKGDGVEPKHLNDLRRHLENTDGDHIRHQVETRGVDAVLKEMNATVESLKAIEREGGGAWEKCRKAGMCNLKTAEGEMILSDDSAVASARAADYAEKKAGQAITDDSDSGLEFSTPN